MLFTAFAYVHVTGAWFQRPEITAHWTFEKDYSANRHISNRSILTWENFCQFFFFWEGNQWKYDDLCNFRVFPMVVVLFLTTDSEPWHASFKGKKKASSASPRSCQTQRNYSHMILSKSKSITHQKEDSDHWHLSDCYSESESESDAVIIDCNVQQVSLVCWSLRG